MKATLNNYRTLCRIMYEFTGLEYWLNRPIYGFYNFIIEFHELRATIKLMVKNGEVCKHHLVTLDGKPVPFSINSVIL